MQVHFTFVPVLVLLRIKTEHAKTKPLSWSFDTYYLGIPPVFLTFISYIKLLSTNSYRAYLLDITNNHQILLSILSRQHFSDKLVSPKTQVSSIMNDVYFYDMKN